MFFSLSVLNLEDHFGLVISPQSLLSAGYITLRACRRSLPPRFSTVTPGGIVGFLIVSYRFNIPDRLVVHLSFHARPELRAHYTLSLIRIKLSLEPVGCQHTRLCPFNHLSYSNGLFPQHIELRLATIFPMKHGPSSSLYCLLYPHLHRPDAHGQMLPARCISGG